MSKNKLPQSIRKYCDPPLTVSPFDDDGSDQEEILRKYEPYIRSLVRKQFPRGMVHPDVLDLAIDEVAEEALVKLWSALQHDCITNGKAYISRIVRSVIADMRRKHKPTQPLPVDEEGELYQGNVIATVGEGMRDPAYEMEQTEMAQQSLVEVIETVCTLPRLQQDAMICFLKERIGDILPLVEILAKYGIDIDATSWPKDQVGSQRFRTTLSIARKKLSQKLNLGGTLTSRHN